MAFLGVQSLPSLSHGREDLVGVGGVGGSCPRHWEELSPTAEVGGRMPAGIASSASFDILTFISLVNIHNN